MNKFNDAILVEPDYIIEIENPVRMSVVDGKDGIFFNDRYTADRRVRTYVYDLLKKALAALPEDYNFVVYEGYRSKADQIKVWNEVMELRKKENPHLDENSEELITMCNLVVANPYRQGSGHQSGAAVDMSLVNDKGIEYDMGGIVRGFGEEAPFYSEVISAEARKNRQILKTAAESVGLVCYPTEWWHYSFGDRLWARMTGSKLAIFAKIDDE